MEVPGSRCAFVSPIPTTFSRPAPASTRRHRPCVCRVATNNNGSEKDDAKRDPIAEWVAKARSQSRARRSKNESEAAKSAADANKQRAGAASALDAVDRLFGSAQSFAGDEPPNRPVRYTNNNNSNGNSRPVTKEQRQKWLSDLRKAASRPPDNEDNGNGSASLTGDSSAAATTRRTPRRTRSRRRRTPRLSPEEPLSAPADDDNDRDGGFHEAEIDFDKNANNNGRPAARKNLSNNRSETRAAPRQSTRASGNNRNNAVKSNSSFSKLLDIARRGGSSGSQRERKPDFDSMFDSLARDDGDSDRRGGASSKSNNNSNGNNNSGNVRNQKSSRDGSKRGASTKESTRGRETAPQQQRRAPRKKSGTRSPVGAVRQLLDMARDTPENGPRESLRESFKNAGALVFDDEDEDVEEYTAKDILRGSDAKGLVKTGRRTSYSQPRRRVGGRQRRILTPPPDWTPMSEDEIGNIRSESAPLAPKRSIGINLIRDCPECYGTGLEMCVVCVGTGWVEPLPVGTSGNRKKKYGENPKTEALIREVWERPNLCIHSDGSAQCPHCKGLGKQLCVHCEGSGSAVTKGFDPAQKYIAFDMFQGGRGSPSDDGMEFDEYDESDEEDTDEDEDDIESMIYTGEVKGYGFSLPLMETSTLESKKPLTEAAVGEDGNDDDDVEEVLEFANGVHDEEHDDFTSKPQRRPMMKRFKSLRDEFVPFNNEMTAFDDLSEDDLALLNETSAGVEVEEEDDDTDDDDDVVEIGLDEVAVLEATEGNEVAADDIDLLDDVSADEDELSVIDDAPADELPIPDDAPADDLALLDVASADDEDVDEDDADDTLDDEDADDVDDALGNVVLVEDDEDSDAVNIGEDEFVFPNGDDDEEETEDVEDSVIDLNLEGEGEEVLEPADAIFEDEEDADEEVK